MVTSLTKYRDYSVLDDTVLLTCGKKQENWLFIAEEFLTNNPNPHSLFPFLDL